MEPIIDYLRRKLKDAGQARWTGIADAINAAIPDERDRMTFHSLRKIAYGDRDNPGLKDAQVILDYFRAVESGAVHLPEPRVEATAKAE